MKLTFLYVPVPDLEAAIPFYRDVLGLTEAWREGESTVAFALPDSDAQLMVDTDQDPAGPMYLVDRVDEWLAAHPDVDVRRPPIRIPDGSVATLADPVGNVFYVFDQAGD